jgi:curli biogenesis system outer membrane secretion channel CsgG
MKKVILCFMACVFFLSVQAGQKKQVVQVESQVQETPASDYMGLKRKVAIARFSNETQYGKGLFYNKENDPMGKQALDILSAKLAASKKFILLERNDMDKIMEEMKLGGESTQKVGADFLIIGSITEFGRKNVGDQNMFSRSKTQTVQAGVSVRLVDVSTGQVIYSEEAKGEAETTSKTVMGLGESADYDATLSDKAISAAMNKLVENIINNCMDKPWKSFFLSDDENGILISGGKSQGLKVGDTFEVIQKGKTVKNPQTGMTIELPGKVVGKVKIDFIGGDDPMNEFSMVTFIEGSIDKTDLTKYFIKEIKN